jgi:hypothetical protein
MVGSPQHAEFNTYLTTALESLFRPVEENGFWDGDRGTFVRALEYSQPSGEQFEWTPDRRQLWRYGPFGLMGVLYWRSSTLGTDSYDEQIRQALDHASAGGDPETYAEMPSYGSGALLAALSMAVEVFDEDRYRESARQLYESVSPLACTHSEDVIVAYGGTYFFDAGSPGVEGERVRETLEATASDFADAVSTDGLIHFEEAGAGWSAYGSTLTTAYDILYGGTRPRRHQNQMYALWALCRLCEVTDRTDLLDIAEGILDYTIDHRMQPDGAFIWEDVSKRSALNGELLSKLGFRVPHWKVLYTCHQTFFVNAVAHYYSAGGTRDYDRELRQAMGWIFGANIRKTDLREMSGLGVPMRQMTTEGRLDTAGQMYKGTYEIGSYIMALTNLCHSTEEFAQAVRSGEQRAGGGSQ